MSKLIEYTIQSMKPEHIESLLELENISFAIPWTKKMFIDDLLNDMAFYFVALLNNRVIGYCGMWVVLDEGQITNVAVHPEYRKLGIARSLIEKLIELSWERGVKAITLEVRLGNTPAQNLYEALGFRNEGIRKGYYSDNGEDALIMWKRL